MSERLYTETEIKAAFWAHFHGSRALTERQWAGFFKALEAVRLMCQEGRRCEIWK